MFFMVLIPKVLLIIIYLLGGIYMKFSELLKKYKDGTITADEKLLVEQELL